jgi:hypothetical protein
MPQSYTLVLPILPEKQSQCQALTEALKTTRAQAHELARQKAGVKHESFYLHGDQLIYQFELIGPLSDYLKVLSQPEDDFGHWYLSQLQDIHGLSPEQITGLSSGQSLFNWHCPSVLEKASETALGIGQNLSHTAQEIFGKASETAEGVSKKVAENAGSLATKAQQQAQDAVHQLQEKTQETTQQLQHQAQEVAHKLQQQAEEARRQAEIKATELLNQAGENVAEATQQIQARATEAIETAAEVGQAVAEKAAGVLNQAFGLFGKKESKDDTAEAPPAEKKD